MKEPGTSQNGDRFGTFVKRIRQKDPREITSIRLADYLGISPTRLCDIEANRRCPTDMEKVGRFCEFFHLDARVRSRLYELAAEARYTIPVFVGGDMTRYQQYDMDRFALRVADWGDPDEEEWKKIIRKAQASGAPLNTLTREDFEALIAIKGTPLDSRSTRRLPALRLIPSPARILRRSSPSSPSRTAGATRKSERKTATSAYTK